MTLDTVCDSLDPGENISVPPEPWRKIPEPNAEPAVPPPLGPLGEAPAVTVLPLTVSGPASVRVTPGCTEIAPPAPKPPPPPHMKEPPCPPTARAVQPVLQTALPP